MGKVEDTKPSDPEGGVALVGTGPIRVDDVPTVAVLREEKGQQKGVKIEAVEGTSFGVPGSQQGVW